MGSQRVQSEQVVKKGYKTEGPLAVEVLADRSGKWAGNALRFDTIDEAMAYGHDLFSRWTAVQNFRVIDADGQIHFTYREA